MRVQRLLVVAAAVAVLGARAQAAGPSNVNGAGTPLAWWGGQPTPIPYNPDLGTLGACANGAGCVAGTQCPDASTCTGIDVTNNADASNYTHYFGICGDGLSPIIFD